MSSTTALSRSLLTACALSLPALAGPQAVLDLDMAERESDLVVAVDVLVVQETGAGQKTISGTAYSCSRVQATCQVLAVLKGQEPEGQRISVEYLQGNDVPLGLEDLRRGEKAVLFLKRVNGEQFSFADDQCSKIPLDAFVPGIARRAGSLRENIGALLVANLERKDPKQVKNVIYWANTIHYPIPGTALRRLSESTNVNMAVIALVPLVQQRDRTAIVRAVKIVLGHYQADRDGVEALAWALEGSAASLSVDEANKLAASDDAVISRIGMRILRTVGDGSSVAVLLKGLDAADKDTQYSAVVGLCRVTGQKGPSWREFMQHRDAEVMRWKKWSKESATPK